MSFASAKTLAGLALATTVLLFNACSSRSSGGGYWPVDGGPDSATGAKGGAGGTGGTATGGTAGSTGGTAGGTGGTATGGTAGSTGGSAGSTGGTGGGPCKRGGQVCQAFSECCSGVCDNQQCTACGAADAACTTNGDCCLGLDCNAGRCSNCRGEGVRCTLAAECCSNTCANGVCTASTANGACRNANDESVKSQFDLQTETFECAYGCLGAAAGCITDCVASATGLSSACAGCYEDGATCALNNCANQCLTDPQSQACTDCRLQYCQAPFVQCSGWTQP